MHRIAYLSSVQEITSAWVELLEAAIPIVPRNLLPAKPITIHQRWEPAEQLEAYLEREDKENLLSYRWLEGHTSQVILKDECIGQNILLVWRFSRSRQKFQTSHQVVDEGGPDLIFYQRMSSRSPAASSLFEKELKAYARRRTIEQKSVLDKLKDQVVTKLWEYLQRIGRRSDSPNPSKTGDTLVREDRIVPLWSLWHPGEDGDRAYVTSVNTESAGKMSSGLKTSLGYNDAQKRSREANEIQSGATGSSHKFPHSESSAYCGSNVAQERAEESFSHCSSKGEDIDRDNLYTVRLLKPFESTIKPGEAVSTAEDNSRGDPVTRQILPQPSDQRQSLSYDCLPQATMRARDMQSPLGTIGEPNNLPLTDRQDHIGGVDESRFGSTHSSNPVASRSSCTDDFESQSRLSSNQTLPTNHTPENGFGIDVNDDQVYPPNDLTSQSLASELMYHSHCDQNHRDRDEDQSSAVSSLSSIGIDIPFPDDFWTWSDERQNYFHIRTEPDGTEETIWYPDDFRSAV